MNAAHWTSDQEGGIPLPRARRVRPQRRSWRLLHSRGRLAVRACSLCTAVVLDEERHLAAHRADVERAGAPQGPAGGAS